MSDDVLAKALRDALTPYFPQFGVIISTPRLTLQLPTDSDHVAMLALIDRGIHDPAEMPFKNEWTDVARPQRDWDSLAHWWRGRSSWTPLKWAWCGMVTQASQIVGVQELLGTNFRVEREVHTGSWLGLEHQGHGIGREMRAAILHFAFAGLGATRARSGYLEGNDASKRVSQSLGYVETGVKVITIRGEPRHEIELVLERTEWQRRRRDDITIAGLDAARALFGAN
jgi:RimJ/RimL family protein N-acetyltransferase